MKRIYLNYLMLIAIIIGASSCKDANITQSTFKLWNRSETASMNQNGIQLILTFDETKLEFNGTMENQNSIVATRVRVEVHTFGTNGNQLFEYGPTTPVDMSPGEIRNISLPAANAGNFVTFSMHPEVGAAEGGG
jgi:hypothetical protein